VARSPVEIRSAIMLRFHDLDLERADRCVSLMKKLGRT